MLSGLCGKKILPRWKIQRLHTFQDPVHQKSIFDCVRGHLTLRVGWKFRQNFVLCQQGVLGYPFQNAHFLGGWWFVKAWSSMDMAGYADHIRSQQDLQEIQGI